MKEEGEITPLSLFQYLIKNIYNKLIKFYKS